MRFAISIPQGCPDGTFDPPAFAAYLLRAEALGFDSAWAMDQTFGPTPRLNALETMTFAAACPTRLRLGCSVWISPLHQPVQLAKSLSTLDQLSGGRLEIGFGSGGQYRMFSAFGLSGDHLISRFTEGIEVMKALWTEPEVTFDGRFYQLRGATMEPKPLQRPYPPVWLGGGAPAAVRRAPRLGGGFFGAGSSTTADFAGQVKILRQSIAEDGGDADSFPVAKRIYIAVDDNTERARTRMADALIGVYGEPFGSSLMPVTVTGPPAACIRGIREVADAGAELILLTALFDETEQMERLAAEIIPHLN
jgi:alkanesulfonate monooxygenase SsuD/methylene tetrahydromethanopterin reductase-like flavin-dependent oxidoreductase (luciferase family)